MNDKLGKEARDKITGFTGTVTDYLESISGLTQYAIQPHELESCKPVEKHWFDSIRVQFIETKESSLGFKIEKLTKEN